MSPRWVIRYRVARQLVLREPARFLIACQGYGYIEDRPMLLPLMLSLVGSALAPANAASARVVSDDPPVKVWLNHDNYYRGDKARVNVRLDDDGYVVVLRADADGRVRVLFPLDPGDDAFVRGGETIEVRGRGDREAFYIDEREARALALVDVERLTDRKSTRLNSSHGYISYAVF